MVVPVRCRPAITIGARIVLSTEGSVANNNASGIFQETDFGAAPVIQAVPGDQIVDGTQFVVSLGGVPITFEFQNNTDDPGNAVNNGGVLIPVDDTMTSVQVATSMNGVLFASALNNVTNSPSRQANDRIILNGPVIYNDINSGSQPMRLQRQQPILHHQRLPIVPRRLRRFPFAAEKPASPPCQPGRLAPSTTPARSRFLRRAGSASPRSSRPARSRPQMDVSGSSICWQPRGKPSALWRCGQAFRFRSWPPIRPIS
jgi:hypothetical protein